MVWNWPSHLLSEHGDLSFFIVFFKTVLVGYIQRRLKKNRQLLFLRNHLKPKGKEFWQFENTPNYKQDFYGKPLNHDWRTRRLLPKQIPLISNKYKVPLDGYKPENLPENHASPTVVKCLSWGKEPLEIEIVWTYLTIWNLNRNNKYFLLFETIR